MLVTCLAQRAYKTRRLQVQASTPKEKKNKHHMHLFCHPCLVLGNVEYAGPTSPTCAQRYMYHAVQDVAVRLVPK